MRQRREVDFQFKQALKAQSESMNTTNSPQANLFRGRRRFEAFLLFTRSPFLSRRPL
jgi:hypothetical protein